MNILYRIALVFKGCYQCLRAYMHTHGRFHITSNFHETFLSHRPWTLSSKRKKGKWNLLLFISYEYLSTSIALKREHILETKGKKLKKGEWEKKAKILIVPILFKGLDQSKDLYPNISLPIFLIEMGYSIVCHLSSSSLYARVSGTNIHWFGWHFNFDFFFF